MEKFLRVTMKDGFIFEMHIDAIADSWASYHCERYIQTGDAETQEQAYEIALGLVQNDDDRLLDWFTTSFSIMDYRGHLHSEFNVSPDDYTDADFANADNDIVCVSS